MIETIQHPPLKALLAAGGEAFANIDAPEAPEAGAFDDEAWEDLEDLEAARGFDDDGEDEDASAANEATDAQKLAALDLKQRAAFILATRQDVQPVADALKQLNEAQGANETSAALLTLSANLDAVEAAVIDASAATQALEVSLAAEFLRGLASLGPPENN